MGMGTPAVIASGFGAANVILRELGKKEYHSQKFKKEYVNYIETNPVPKKPKRIEGEPDNARLIARECQHCENQPCMDQCPADIDIAGFIRRIEAGNYIGAARLIHETNPFPEMCGYLCPSEQLCEKACVRTKYASKPVQIRELHKWVAQHAGKDGWSPPVAQPNKKKICIVGFGVAGLTCSHYLSRLGHTIDLLDEASHYERAEIFATAKEVPEEVKQRELSGIISTSTTFKGNFVIKNRDQLAELSKNYDAVYITKQLGRNSPDDFDKGLKNVLIETTNLSDIESKSKIAFGIENGRKAAIKLHSLLQRRDGNEVNQETHIGNAL
jgi:glutamate synthase (NADPH/NADH) small chain